MDKMILQFNTDVGHGWLTSNTTQLMKLGIYDKVSRYSYINTARANADGSYNVYLEEDCDAPLLLNALKERGIDYVIDHIDHNDYCFIRRKPHFPSQKETV